MARRVSLPSADDLFRATEKEQGREAEGRTVLTRAPSTPYRTSPTRRRRRPADCADRAAGSSTTRR